MTKPEMLRRKIFRQSSLIVNAFTTLAFRHKQLKPKSLEYRIKLLARETLKEKNPSGKTISFLRSGAPNGKKVLFVHGSPGSATGWADYLLSPLPGFEYLALDRLGFGESSRSPVISLTEQVRALEMVLRRNNTSQVILIGHSLGAGVVAKAALLLQDLVAGIIVISGALDPDLEEVVFLQPWARKFKAYISSELYNSNEELLAYKKELEAFTPFLGEVKCPVTIIHGKKDVEVPYQNIFFTQKIFCNSTNVCLYLLEEEAHYLPWRKPKLIQSAIKEISLCAF